MRSSVGDDPAGLAGALSVPAQGMLGAEVEVTLDRKPEPSANRADFGKADIAELRFAKAEIAEAK